MRRISNLQWLFILAISALIVFLVGATSLYIKLKLPGLLPPDVNDSPGAWAFAAFWAIHAPLILLWSRRFSFERGRLIKSLAIFFSAGMSWATLVQGLPLLLVLFLRDPANSDNRSFQISLIDWFGSNLLSNIALYWIILSIGLIFSYYEQLQIEKLKASQLDAQLSKSRLQTLQMQLQPHFLFNTLHSISALVLVNETHDAVKMINRLSELLRATIDQADTPLTTLKAEIGFTERYLEIERIRFQDRLTVEMDIDRRALTAEVPTLILQPLVENAMRHGVDSNAGTSRIEIAARLQNGQVLMEVRDDGKNFKTLDGHAGTGLGIKNTRARLAEIYGEDYSFSVERDENERTIARIIIPFISAAKEPTGEKL
jgi:sensor histidine kinase YesM